MKIRDFFTKTRKEVIESEILRLKKYKSYNDGTRDAKDQAFKNYETLKRSLNQQRWFKIIKQNDHPTIVWSKNNSITMVFYTDGNFKYDDEITENTNFCRVIGASTNSKISFYGTIKEIIEAVKADNFSNEKENLLPPVEHFII